MTVLNAERYSLALIATTSSWGRGTEGSQVRLENKSTTGLKHPTDAPYATVKFSEKQSHKTITSHRMRHMNENDSSSTERGEVSIESPICSCEETGQEMVKQPLGGYRCPNCGQVAELVLRWGPDNVSLDTDEGGERNAQ